MSVHGGSANICGIPGLIARMEAALEYSRTHENDRISEMEWRAHLADALKVLKESAPMSDARACRYHGEVLRDDREFIAVDGEEHRVVIRVNQGGALVRLTLSHAEASELCRHLRNCKP